MRPCGLPLAFDVFFFFFFHKPIRDTGVVCYGLDKAMPQLNPVNRGVTKVKMWLLKGNNLHLRGVLYCRGRTLVHCGTDIVLNRHCPQCKIGACVLLQKLSKVLTELLTAWPLAHTMTVQRMGSSAFFM